MPNSVENFLMTAFSLKMLVVYALVAVIIAVPTWLLVKFSRNFPPAITHPSLKSGVGGWLIVFLAGQVGRRRHDPSALDHGAGRCDAAELVL